MHAQVLGLQDQNGNTPLHDAIVAGNDDIALAFIAIMQPQHLILPNANGDVPLHVAINCAAVCICTSLLTLTCIMLHA